jgi:hypothetical protein
MTWPKPIAIQSYPGEKGTTSIPHGDGIQAFVWDMEDITKDQDWSRIILETKQLTVELLAGKHGPIQTFAGDGLHKLYACYLHQATNGASARGEEFDPRCYGSASTKFFQYLDLVMRSSVANVVFTVWDGPEKDDPDDKKSDRHIFPELPGQAAKRVMGEFSVVLYANREGAGDAAKYTWQTKPGGKIWGSGVKAPLELAKKIPMKVEQNWSVLEKYLVGA